MDLSILFTYAAELIKKFFGLELSVYGAEATFGQVILFGALTWVVYTQAKRYMSHG